MGGGDGLGSWAVADRVQGGCGGGGKSRFDFATSQRARSFGQVGRSTHATHTHTHPHTPTRTHTTHVCDSATVRILYISRVTKANDVQIGSFNSAPVAPKSRLLRNWRALCRAVGPKPAATQAPVIFPRPQALAPAPAPSDVHPGHHHSRTLTHTHAPSVFRLIKNSQCVSVIARHGFRPWACPRRPHRSREAAMT